MRGGWYVDPGPPGDPKGRRLVAARPHQPGDAVLQEQPYAAVLYSDHLASHCDCCLQPAADLLRCSGCKLAHYRGREHQLRAWRGGHREECSALKQLAPRVPPPTVRLAARAVLQHHRVATTSSSSEAADQAAAADAAGDGDRWGEVLALQHHWEEVPDRLKIQYAQMGALAWQIVQLASPAAAEGVTPRDLALLIARFACNNHTICDDELRPVGVGIYPLVSMANHSCTPNCMQSFQGSTLVLRAVRPIAPGGEITIAYVELGATRWERRSSLLAQYYFDLDVPQPAASGSGGEPSVGAAAELQLCTAAAAPAGPAAGSAQPGQVPSGDTAAATPADSRPAAQPAQVLQLSDTTRLRLYCSASPPWPCDARDRELTAVHWAGAPAGQPAAGGMWGEFEAQGAQAGSLLQPGSSPAFESEDWGSAAESFPLDAEGHQEGAGALAAGLGDGSGSAGSGVDNVGRGADVPGGSYSSCRAKQVIIHCWLQPGAGGSSSGSAGGSSSGGAAEGGPALDEAAAQAAAASLAGVYARALLQLGSAEQLLGGGGGPGGTAAAAQLLQQALASLGGSGGTEEGGAGAQRRPGQDGRRKAPGGGAVVRGPAHGSAVPTPELVLGPRHVLRMRLLAAAARAAVAAGDRWQQALQWMRELLPLYEFVYPEVWPNLGLHWASIAKLEHFMGGRAQQAQQAAQRALAILGRTHGAGAGAVEEVRRVLFEASQELAVEERMS